MGVTTSGKCYAARVDVTNLLDDPKNEPGFFTIYQGNPNARISKGSELNVVENCIIEELNGQSSIQNKITLFPNPAYKSMYVTGLSEGDEIEIISLDGKVIFNIPSIVSSNQKIDLKEIAPGYHYIKITSMNCVRVLPLIKL